MAAERGEETLREKGGATASVISSAGGIAANNNKNASVVEDVDVEADAGKSEGEVRTFSNTHPP